MQDLFEQVQALATLRAEATPGPWVQWDDKASVYAGPAEINTPGHLSGVRVKIAECEINPEYDMMSDFDEEHGPYDGQANAAFLAAIGGLDFAAVAAALATQPAPLADAALADIKRLDADASAAPWFVVPDTDEFGTAHLLTPQEGSPVGIAGNPNDFANFTFQDDAELSAALRNALPGLLARLRAAEAKATEASSELGKVQHYISSLLNDLLNHPELPASIQNALWQQRAKLTIEGSQPNA